jgi:hypothetical protein
MSRKVGAAVAAALAAAAVNALLLTGIASAGNQSDPPQPVPSPSVTIAGVPLCC